MRSEPTQTQAAPRYDLGLVLEGGAIRGIYTAGVLDVLMAHGLQADMVIGTSAGCIHGCNFVSGQAGRSIRYYRKYRRNRHFMGLYALLTTGEIISADRKLDGYTTSPNQQGIRNIAVYEDGTVALINSAAVSLYFPFNGTDVAPQTEEEAAE